jgi:sugar lactone lactonase YvrE
VSYPAPGPHPEGLAWDGTHLWSADWETRKIYRHAVTDSGITVVGFFDAPRPESGTRPVGLTWDGSALWLTTWYPVMLYRLDPMDGAVLYSRSVVGLYALPPFPTSYAPEDLAWDGSHLWLTDWFTPRIFELDPTTLAVLDSLDCPGHASVGLTFHQGHLWNGDTGDRALYRLEVTGGTPTRPITWGRLKRGAGSPLGP